MTIPQCVLPGSYPLGCKQFGRKQFDRPMAELVKSARRLQTEIALGL